MIKSKQKLELRARQMQDLMARVQALSDWPAPLRYAVTTLLVALSFLICLALEGVSNYPLFVFMPPIILASFLFDRNAGYFAAALSALVALGFLMSLEFPFLPEQAGKLVAALAFLLVGLFTAYIVEVMRITIGVLSENARLREDKRRLEKELFHAQKMEAVGRANSILAHDFKNILSPIMTSVHIFRMRLPQPDDDIAEVLDVLDNVCRRGSRLADDIRSFARKEQSECIAVNLNESVLEAMPAFRQSVEESVSLELKLAEGIPEACVDPALLERSLANLIGNAADAMPDGGTITIETSLSRLSGTDCVASGRCAPGEYVSLAVRDTGTGIPPEIKARLFEPFFTTKPSGRGTGLGLAMVADSVRQAQGCVTVDSLPGQGTTVKLFLPPYQELMGQAASLAQQADGPPAATQTRLATRHLTA